MDNLVKVGIIGCGRLARLYHMSQYIEIPQAQLVAFHDKDAKQARKLSLLYKQLLKNRLKEADEESNEVEVFSETLEQIKVYEDPIHLIEDVDVVDVCTPPNSHVHYALETLRRDTNVMVEKPMARSWIEALPLKEVAHTSEGLFQYNENFVFDPFYATVRRIIQSGEIGDIQRIYLTLGHGGPNIDSASWFCDPKIQGGGALMDFGTHAITTAWYLTGLDNIPTKVHSNEITIKHPHRIIGGKLRTLSVEDDSKIEILLENPKNKRWITLYVQGTWAWPTGNSSKIEGTLNIEGTKGVISRVIEPDGTANIKIDIYGYGSRCQKTSDLLAPLTQSPYSPPLSFSYEIRNFINCAQSRSSLMLDVEIGTETLALAGAGYLSEKIGRETVTLQEFKEYCFKLKHKYGDKASDRLINELMEPYKAKI